MNDDLDTPRMKSFDSPIKGLQSIAAVYQIRSLLMDSLKSQLYP